MTTINHREQAEKHLDTAARHLTEHPGDMRIAEVAAAIGQGYATLARDEDRAPSIADMRDALTHSGPGYDTAPLPARGDAFETWLRAQRDATTDGYTRDPEWEAIDAVLDAYRLHADSGTPLGEHACEGRVVGDCECFETANPIRGNC